MSTRRRHHAAPGPGRNPEHGQPGHVCTDDDMRVIGTAMRDAAERHACAVLAMVIPVRLSDGGDGVAIGEVLFIEQDANGVPLCFCPDFQADGGCAHIDLFWHVVHSYQSQQSGLAE